MKKLFAVLMILASPLMAATTYTSRTGIPKPADGDTGWGTTIRQAFDIIDSSMCLPGASNTFTGTNSFLNVVLSTGSSIKLYSSDNSNFSFVTNPTTSDSGIELAGTTGGVGINAIPLDPDVTGVALSIFPAVNQTYGSFAVIGSSNDSSTAYSGFKGTAPIDQSTLWSLPKKDGTSAQAMLTDGAGNLYFGSVAGGGSGSLPLPAGATNYIQISNSLQSGSTAYISSFTVDASFIANGFASFGSSVTLTGTGPGTLDLTEGSGALAGPSAVGHDVLWADSSSNTIVFNPNNTSTYTVVGSSSVPTVGHLASWSGQGKLVDGGAAGSVGSGITVPGTFTWTNAFGISVSTIVVSSNTFLAGTTFYQGGRIGMGGTFGANPSQTSSLYINAGNSLASGGGNIMIGDPNLADTGSSLITGNGITCMGKGSCISLVSATGITAVGKDALAVSSGGVNNTAFGSGALIVSTTGNQNTAIGRLALDTSVSGANNTALGYQACHNTLTSSTTLSGSICLGYQSYVDASNVMAIGGISVPVTDVYMNSRAQVTDAIGSSVTFHAQASSGTNRSGGNFYIQAGEGTGTGTPGAFIVKVSTLQATGTKEQISQAIATFAYPGIGLLSQTAAQILTIAPSQVGQLIYCSNCTALRVCVSTGTVAGAWSSPVATTVACN